MKVIHLSEIDSTNDHAKRLILTDEIKDKTVIVADVQRAGRGRLNQRVWVSELGNFHGSYVCNLIDYGISESDANLITSQVLIRLRDYLLNLTGSNKISIKLPNDILILDKKIAGVLVEIIYPYAIIGIGLNLKVSPIERSTNIYSEFGIELSWRDITENFRPLLKHLR